jgi:hypothetical protein
MDYIKIKFSYGQKGQGYLEIGNDGEDVVRITDLSGNTLNIENPYGVFIMDKTPPKPSWGR